MKILVDGFGGDNAPLEVIKGCRMAADEYKVQITLVGREEELKKAAEEAAVSLDGIELMHADDVLTMEDSPKDVVRGKKNCSMAVGLRALSSGEGDAFVSAGNTGALVVGSMLLVRCIKGVKRPALAPILPNSKGCFMLLDAGANAECKPDMLAQFGLMGSVYMNKIMHVNNPRVGLVNIGTEEHKGTDLQREAFALLKQAKCNFVGNVEGRDIPLGSCDVAVADGFTGNIVLKLTEGLGLAFGGFVKDIFKRNAISKLSAMLVLPGLKAFKKKMDYTEYGGAPLMGTAKPVIKAHGSSNAVAFKNAIRQAIAFVEEGVIGEIEANLPYVEETEEQPET